MDILRYINTIYYFIIIYWVLFKIIGTNSLKCYHCSEFTGTDQISCRAPKEIECAKDEDRCIKIKLKTNGTGMVDEEAAVNCSTSAKCNEFCKDYRKNHANILECSHKCCEGDLCNHPHNSTSPVVASSTKTPATGTSSGTGITTTPGEPTSAEPSSLIQNVKAVVLLLALMGLILVFWIECRLIEKIQTKHAIFRFNINRCIIPIKEIGNAPDAVFLTDSA